MQAVLKLFPKKTKGINFRIEILSGITVALALVPEAVAFAIIAGLPPLMGLYSAFFFGIITAVFGGRPGMISGATGAIAVVLTPLVLSHGVQYVLAAILLAGVLQLLAGIFKLGKFIRLVPESVMYGFVNGLGIVIFMAQMGQFKNDGVWKTGGDLMLNLALVIGTMLVLWLLPKFTKVVPSGLAAILFTTAIVIGFGIDTRSVGDVSSIAGGLPSFHFPDVPMTLETLTLIFPYALVIAGVGLIESLLTLNLLDEITETRGSSNKECVAQGASSALTGIFGGMGGCATVGQSLMNISAGARSRVSAASAAIMLLGFVLWGSKMIEAIPMAALTGIMIMIAVGTFEWASFKIVGKFPMSDIIIMIIVATITVVAHNLALAVLVGVIIAALIFAWQNAKHIHAVIQVDENGAKHYQLEGPLFFGSVASFYELFNTQDDPDEIYIDFMNSRVADMSGIEALNKLTERYKKYDKKIHIQHLSPDCRSLLKNAEKLIEVNIVEDPNYHVVHD
jgi:SulP family sulfate permease